MSGFTSIIRTTVILFFGLGILSGCSAPNRSVSPGFEPPPVFPSPAQSVTPEDDVQRESQPAQPREDSDDDHPSRWRKRNPRRYC